MRDLFVPPEPPKPSPSGPRDLAALTSPRIRDDAIKARARLLAAIDNTFGQIPAWWRPRGKRGALRVLRRHYVPAIEAIRSETSEDDLRALQGNLTRRLERGWQLEPTPKRDELAARLLAEYEIVTDALEGAAISRHVSRLNDLEQRWPD